MKAIITTVACGLILLWAGTLRADPPHLESSVYIYDGANPLEVGSYSAPTSVDWNNDGKKDLLVGVYQKSTTGLAYILLFLNQGTDQNPAFSGWSYVESNGSPIIPPHG